MNEMFYYISLDFSFSFTTVNLDDVGALSIGTILNALIILMLSLNCSIMLFDQGRVIYFYLKRFYFHR